MTPMERLIRIGMNCECAIETINWYTIRCDTNGLEEFIKSMETLYEAGKIQPKSTGT